MVDLEEVLLSCDRLDFLLGRTWSSDDGFERDVFGDMVLGVLLLLFAMAALVALETGTCIPREGRDSDLRRVSYGIVLKGGVREYVLRGECLIILLGDASTATRLAGRKELNPKGVKAGRYDLSKVQCSNRSDGDG